MPNATFLTTVPLFHGLSREDIETIDAALGHETLETGQDVLAEGYQGDTLYILLSGLAVVTVRTPKGDRELSRLGPGEYFGEMAMFDDEPRSATVTTLTACEMLTLQRDAFQELAHKCPAMLMQICRVFGDRVRAMNRQMVLA